MTGAVLATTSPMVWYVTRASGLMSLLLLTAATALGLLTTSRAGSATLPRFAVSELHRRVSLLAVVFLGIHVVTAVLDSFVHISVLAVVVPFYPGYSPLWVGLGAVAFDLLAAVVITSLARRALPANVWRGVHWLAYLSWPIAVAHCLGVGSDARFGWVDVVVAGCVVAVLAALGWRIWARPHRSWLRTAVPQPPAGGVSPGRAARPGTPVTGGNPVAPAGDRGDGSRLITSSSRTGRR